MYTKMQAYRELGNLIHQLLDLPQTEATTGSIDALYYARSKILRTTDFSKIRGVQLIRIAKPVEKVLPTPRVIETIEPHKKGLLERSLRRFPLAAIQFFGGSGGQK